VGLAARETHSKGLARPQSHPTLWYVLVFPFFSEKLRIISCPAADGDGHLEVGSSRPWPPGYDNDGQPIQRRPCEPLAAQHLLQFSKGRLVVTIRLVRS